MTESPRLLIRRIQPGDLDAMMAVYGDPIAMQYVDDGLPIGEADCRRWIDVTLQNYGTRGYGMFAVERLDTQDVVGFCGLVHPGGQSVPELKYAYLQSAWGLGYATEAAIRLLEYGRTVHGMTRVIATTSPDNAASHRVLVKAGMHDIGVQVEGNGERIQVFEWS